MRVAQINSVCGYGSTGRIVVDISRALKKNNIDNHVFYAFGASDLENSSKFSSDLYVKYNVLKTRLFGKHSFYSKLSTRTLLRRLNKYHPDIIHLHQPHGHYINIKMLIQYCNRKLIPLVWTLHDCWALTGHCVHFTVANCDKWKTICNKCPQLKSYPRSLIFDRSEESYAEKKELVCTANNITFVAVSDWIDSIAKQSFLNSQKIVKIYNGVDTNVFYPRNTNKLRLKYGLHDEFIVLGMANKWFSNNSRVNIDTFANEIGAGVVLFLIGIDKDITNLPKNVFGIERVNNVNELAEYYSLADVFVNLSLEDSFGLVSAEALSCGTPVIAYRSTACPEIIGDNSCGEIVEPNDFKNIMNAVKHIQANQKSLYSPKCRKRVIELYDMNTTCSNYIDLYTNIRKKLL